MSDVLLARGKKLRTREYPMIMKLASTMFCCLFLIANACDSKSGDRQAASPNAPPSVTSPAPANASAATGPQAPTALPASSAKSGGLVDACTMIDKSEIAAVQGAPVQSVVPNTQLNGALTISQCYFTVNSADGSQNLSVHLEVIQADSKSPNAVKEYWERSFGEKQKGADAEEEKEGNAPQAVSGLGDEAFWIGNAKVGALYAMKKSKMVRVSIGGAGDSKTKIEKSKRLVADVLQRLS
jgi:hypothetical protein